METVFKYPVTLKKQTNVRLVHIKGLADIDSPFGLSKAES